MDMMTDEEMNSMDTRTDEEVDTIATEELDSIEAASKEKLEAMIRKTTEKMIREASAQIDASGTDSMSPIWTVICVILGLSMWVGIILASHS
jgi:Flp pilus assembly protein TadB